MNEMIRVKKFLREAEIFQRAFPFYFQPNTHQTSVSITIGDKELINFCTFSYLGLSDHPEVIAAAKHALDIWGVGNHGTRCLGGNLHIYTEVETKLQQITGKEKAVLFNSGYLANLATIQCLMQTGGVVYSAQKNHASIEDGLMLARGRVETFHHRKLNELDQQLAQEDPKTFKLIVSDSVFSMAGDVVDLPKLIALRERHPNTMIMLDEAHSIGVLGESGRGIEEYHHVPPHQGADILMGSLSKAIPGNGGYIAGSARLMTYLRYNLRPTIFSAGLPGATAAATHQALCLLERDGKKLGERLQANLALLRRLLREANIPHDASPSPITTIFVGDLRRVFEMATACYHQGLHVLPVFFPAVPKGAERLRITISARHTEEHIRQGVAILQSVGAS